MSTARILIALLLLSLIGVPTILAQDPATASTEPPVELRYRWTPGTTLNYDALEQLSSHITAGGRTGSSETEAPYHITFDVLEPTPDGHARLLSLTTHEAVRAKRLIDNGVDVTHEFAKETPDSFEGHRSTLDILTLDAQGRPAKPPPSSNWKAALRTALEEIRTLPTEAVAPGGAWSREEKIGPLTIRAEYRWDRIETRESGRIALCSGVIRATSDDLGESTPLFDPLTASLELSLDEGIVERFECHGRYRVLGRDRDQKGVDQDVSIVNSWTRIRAPAPEDAEARHRLAGQGGDAFERLQNSDFLGALTGFEAFAAKHAETPWTDAVREEAKRLREAFPRLGETPPALAIKEWLNGGPHTIEALRGMVIVLDFWSSWSIPCRKSMAKLKQLHKEYKGNGLAILGITAYDENQDATGLRAFLLERSIPYVVAIDQDGATAKAYRVESPPYTLVVNREGKIIWEGSPEAFDELKGVVEQAIGPVPK